MNSAQTIFSLFYAILFGAIFTISDRWRPFTCSGETREGRKRVNLSILLLGVFPVLYFLFTFSSLSSITLKGILSLGIVIYLVVPLYAFYISWVMIVSFNKSKYYSAQEQDKPPIVESLFWIADRPPSKLYLFLFYAFFILIPIILVSCPSIWGSI